jgi:hypothetical protein
MILPKDAFLIFTFPLLSCSLFLLDLTLELRGELEKLELTAGEAPVTHASG